MASLPNERIDAHQHFWTYSAEEYPWIPVGTPLHRDWLPEDLAREQMPLGVNGCIAVQARQTLEESRWLLDLADHHARIRAVVGWADLRSATVADDLAALAAHPKFAGVRHVVQSEPDDRFLVGENFRRGIGILEKLGLTYDLLVIPRQLPAAIELVREFPRQAFVLDHIAKPEIRTGAMEPWRTQLRELAKHENVMCKISGLVTEADHRAWTRDQLRPYLDIVFEAFGTKRLMWGSDWPVCLLAAEYKEVLAVVDEYTSALASSARDAILGGNALRFYCGRVPHG